MRDDHTDRRALGALVELERGIRDEYTDGGRQPNAISAHSQLVCAAVGRHGGLGEGTLSLINLCARRRGNRADPDLQALAPAAETFAGVWRHRLSMLVAAATSQRIRINAAPPEHAHVLCLARREANARRFGRAGAIRSGQSITTTPPSSS